MSIQPSGFPQPASYFLANLVPTSLGFPLSNKTRFRRWLKYAAEVPDALAKAEIEPKSETSLLKLFRRTASIVMDSQKYSLKLKEKII